MIAEKINTDDKTIEVISYLLQNYPRIKELSAPRLMWLLYLIDWKASIDLNRQLTGIEWYNDDSGPSTGVGILDYLNDNRRHFEINSFQNRFSGKRQNFWFSNTSSRREGELSPQEEMVVQFIIDNTSSLSWRELSSIIFSTPPVKSSSVSSRLNLVHFADEFKKGG